GHIQWRGHQADRPRVQAALLFDASPVPGRLSIRTSGPSLSAGFRPRLEYDRGVHRTAPAQNSCRHHPHRARPRILSIAIAGRRREREERHMRANSLALRLVISSAAWTLMILSVTAAI